MKTGQSLAPDDGYDGRCSAEAEHVSSQVNHQTEREAHQHLPETFSLKPFRSERERERESDASRGVQKRSLVLNKLTQLKAILMFLILMF